MRLDLLDPPRVKPGLVTRRWKLVPAILGIVALLVVLFGLSVWL